MKYTLFLCLTFCSCSVFTQERLSKEEMRQDLEFLAQTVRDVCPHIAIRQAITGTDIYSEIDSLAGTACKSFEEFYYTAKRILILCQDMHNDLRSYPKGIDETNNSITLQAIEISDSCEMIYDKYHPEGSMAGIEYFDGRYFFTVDIYNKTGGIMIPAGAELIKVNDIPVREYVNKYNRQADNSVRWDFKRNEYYTLRIYPADVTMSIADTYITYVYGGNEKSKIFQNSAMMINSNTSIDEHEPKVLYFRRDGILYIRIPSMDFDECDFFVQNIEKYRNVEKVIIDIRNNGGGNDALWRTILSAIVDKPVITKVNCYIRDTPTTVKYAKEIRGIELVGTKMKLCDQDYVCAFEDNDTIMPAAKSLKYDGKIYVLLNERCFSSSLAFVELCKRSDSFVTVGQPTGYIGGRGISPFFFAMPNSKLIFAISPLLDATHGANIADFYDRNVDVPVELSADDKILEIKYPEERYGEEFLFNHDPVFRKVLELP